MGIKDRQLFNYINKSAREKIINGILPLKKEINKEINNNRFGVPVFKYVEFESGKVAKSNDYNLFINTLFEDVNTIYEEIIEQHNKVMAINHYYEVEKSKIYFGMNKLNKEIEEINELINGNKDCVFNTFNDFKMIELEGSQGMNGVKTDALIDLRNGEVRLKAMQEKTKKIDLRKSTISIIKEKGIKIETLSNVEEALNENINDGWRIKIRSSNKDKKLIQVKIELDSVEVNKINVLLQAPRKCGLGLMISEDGKNYKSLEDKELTNKGEWNFKTIKVKTAILNIIKEEADSIEDNEYCYYIGLQNIVFEYIEHIRKSRLVTLGNKLSGKVNNVMLKADEIIPSGTNIRYYIIQSDINQFPIGDKIEIKNNQSISLNRYKEVSEISTAITGSRININNKEYYAIKSVVDKIRNINMLNGISKCEFKKIKNYTDINNVSPGVFNDWEKLNVLSTYEDKLKDVENLKSVTVENKDLIYINMYIETEKKKVLNHIIEKKSNSIALGFYINGTYIKEIKDVNKNIYNYELNEGLNQIELLIYKNGVGNETLDLNIEDNISNNWNSFRAYKYPMKETSYYNLVNKIENSNEKYYAIKDDNIYVASLENKLIVGENIEKFKIDYEELRGEKEDNIYIRLIAELEGDIYNNEISPVLKSYKIIGT